MTTNKYVYIIDTYSRFDQEEIVDVFNINSQWYAIKKVELDFGKPILYNLEKSEDESLFFKLYESLDEAKQYVKQIKRLEGVHF